MAKKYIFFRQAHRLEIKCDRDHRTENASTGDRYRDAASRERFHGHYFLPIVTDETRAGERGVSPFELLEMLGGEGTCELGQIPRVVLWRSSMRRRVEVYVLKDSSFG